jgi:6-phosphofructokinase 1
MDAGQGRLGILVGGGPAPGINSAISAAAIAAINAGLEVIGIYDGFSHLMQGRADRVTPLRIADVSRIHVQGGAILRTSRANPTRKEADLQRTVATLKELGITRLVTIGGDDTAFSALEVSRAGGGALRSVHIPKTIDNDLPLPNGAPTFGYETARDLGTRLALNLLEDARTTNRWYIVSAMGRNAGHLALGIGRATGATLTIIAEEFASESIDIDAVCDIVEGAMLKQRINGQEYGLAVLAEGIAEKIPAETLAQLPGVEIAHDQHGHLRLEEIPLEKVVKREILRRFAERGEKLAVVDRTIGYELRSAAPVPFDIDYTRTLGYGAVKFLLSDPGSRPGQAAGMVCLRDGRIDLLPFDDMRDPTTGRTRVRLVDISSESYQVARHYMTRLEKADLQQPDVLGQLAAAAAMTPQDFARRFANVV